MAEKQRTTKLTIKDNQETITQITTESEDC